ncbi:MAG: hypothetical protein ACRDY5_07790 [Acidimicrobiales bacterium]
MTEPHRPRSPAATGIVDTVALGLVLLAMMALTAPALRVPPHVDRVTVNNPHPWNVSVELVDVDGRRRLALGPFGSASDQSFLEVLDQGVEWVFRFSSAGRSADVHRAGRQLEDAGWRVTVPESLAADLRAAAIPRSAR